MAPMVQVNQGGIFRIGIIEAKHLHEHHGKCHPFVKVMYDGKPQGKTQHKETRHPHWNHEIDV